MPATSPAACGGVDETTREELVGLRWLSESSHVVPEHVGADDVHLAGFSTAATRACGMKFIVRPGGGCRDLR